MTSTVGGESWNCSAADMFDCGEMSRQDTKEVIPLRYELCRPLRIVSRNVDFFAYGLF